MSKLTGVLHQITLYQEVRWTLWKFEATTAMSPLNVFWKVNPKMESKFWPLMHVSILLLFCCLISINCSWFDQYLLIYFLMVWVGFFDGVSGILRIPRVQSYTLVLVSYGQGRLSGQAIFVWSLNKHNNGRRSLQVWLAQRIWFQQSPHWLTHNED